MGIRAKISVSAFQFVIVK